MAGIGAHGSHGLRLEWASSASVSALQGTKKRSKLFQETEDQGAEPPAKAGVGGPSGDGGWAGTLKAWPYAGGKWLPQASGGDRKVSRPEHGSLSGRGSTLRAMPGQAVQLLPALSTGGQSGMFREDRNDDRRARMESQ